MTILDAHVIVCIQLGPTTFFLAFHPRRPTRSGARESMQGLGLQVISLLIVGVNIEQSIVNRRHLLIKRRLEQSLGVDGGLVNASALDMLHRTLDTSAPLTRTSRRL